MEKELSHEQVISTSRLTKAFDTLVAVNDLHLEVLRGDVFGFLAWDPMVPVRRRRFACCWV